MSKGELQVIPTDNGHEIIEVFPTALTDGTTNSENDPKQYSDVLVKWLLETFDEETVTRVAEKITEKYGYTLTKKQEDVIPDRIVKRGRYIG